MEEFLQAIRTIKGKLALASDPINDSNLSFMILRNLPSDYRSLKTHVRARTTPTSFDELSSLLISEEINIKNETKLAAQTNPNDPITAYQSFTQNHNNNNHASSFTNYRGRGGNNRAHDGNHFYNNGGRFNQSHGNNYNGGRFNQFRGGGGRYWNQRGRGGGRFQNQHQSYNNEAFCQHCGRNNHYSNNCYFKGEANHNNHAYTASTNSSVHDYLLDSGANNHAIREMNNNYVQYPYQGNQNVTSGKWKGACYSTHWSWPIPRRKFFTGAYIAMACTPCSLHFNIILLLLS